MCETEKQDIAVVVSLSSEQVWFILDRAWEEGIEPPVLLRKLIVAGMLTRWPERQVQVENLGL